MHFGNMDTIARLRQRHADFELLRDRILGLGTDSRSYFGNGYSFEGGLSLQQNPDELAAPCLCLRSEGPSAITWRSGRGAEGRAGSSTRWSA